MRDRHTNVPRRGQRGERIQLVVATSLSEMQITLRRAAEKDRAVAGDRPIGASAGNLGETEALHIAPAAACQHPRKIRIAAVDNEPAQPRHHPHQMVELCLDGGQIGKDVRVIVFEIVEDAGARAVMHELRALVEVCGVVFVGLDHEERAVRQPRRHGEIERHTADQEAGVESRVVEDGRQHRGRGGLAMRARHRQHPAIGQHLLVEPLGAGDIGPPGVEDGLHQRIAARHDVADDEDIGIARDAVQLRRIEALGKRDALRRQLRGHGRIDVGVATRHRVSCRAGDGRHPAHEGATDAKDVEVHGIEGQAETAAGATTACRRQPRTNQA